MRLQISTGRRFGRGPFVARPERTLRRLCFGLAALTALVIAPAVAQEVEDGEPPIDPEMAAGYFEEARELEAANPWPGTLTGPILFVDPAS